MASLFHDDVGSAAESVGGPVVSWQSWRIWCCNVLPLPLSQNWGLSRPWGALVCLYTLFLWVVEAQYSVCHFNIFVSTLMSLIHEAKLTYWLSRFLASDFSMHTVSPRSLATFSSHAAAGSSSSWIRSPLSSKFKSSPWLAASGVRSMSRGMASAFIRSTWNAIHIGSALSARRTWTAWS